MDLNFIDHTSDIGWKEFRRVKPIIINPGLYMSKKADVFWITQRRSIPTAFKLFTDLWKMKTTTQMPTPTISNAIIVKKCFMILRCSRSITRIGTIGSMKYFITSVKIVETSTPVRLYYNYICVGMAMSDNTAMANAVISNRLSGPLIDRGFLTAEHGGDSDVGFSDWMEKNNHGAADNIPRISSQSEQNEQPEFGFQPDYGGTLSDDMIFQANHLQRIPLPHIFSGGSRQDVTSSSQPYKIGLMGDGHNVIGNLSLNYAAEPNPQRILNAESTFLSPVENITTNFQSPHIDSSLGSIEGSRNARFWSHDHKRLIYHTDRLPSLQRTTMSCKTVMANAMLSNRLSGPLIDEGDSGSGCFLSMKGNMGGRNLPRNHGRLMGITNNWTMLCIAAQNYSGPDDNQSSGFQTGKKCYICKRDVDYAPTGTMSKPCGTIPTAVLACEHVFHECLCRG